MSGLIDGFKALFVPLVIAAFLYLLAIYAIIPAIRQHRNRYDQYLPVHLSEHTSSLRARIGNSLTAFALPSWSRRRGVEHADDPSGRRESSSGDELAFGEDEGENLVGFDVSRRDRQVRGGRVEIGSDRRLSRDLEEGFRDDSDEEAEDAPR